jgi:hypothetical protein
MIVLDLVKGCDKKNLKIGGLKVETKGKIYQ